MRNAVCDISTSLDGAVATGPVLQDAQAVVFVRAPAAATVPRGSREGRGPSSAELTERVDVRRPNAAQAMATSYEPGKLFSPARIGTASQFSPGGIGQLQSGL